MSGLDLKRLAMNTAGVLGRQIGSGLLQLITLAIIARLYGPAGNGIYTLALLLPTMLAMVLNMGIGPANVYYLGAGKVHPQQAWQVTLRFSITIGAIGWLLGGLAISSYGGKWFPGVPSNVLWLTLLFFPVTFISGAIGNIFQGLQSFRQFNIVLLVQPTVNLVLVILTVWMGVQDIFYIIVCYLASTTLNLIIAYLLLMRLLAKKSGPAMPYYGRNLINYGYKAHLSNILAFVNNRADMFLISYFIGPAAVGVYAVAVSITEKLWLFSGAISTVLLPRLSQLSSDEEKRNALTPLIARWSLWLTFFAALILAAVGELIVGVIFGQSFLKAYIVIVWLLPGVVLGACSMVLANDMAARGRPELNLATSWISVSINVIGNIILIPRFGIAGAAAATSFAYVINMMMRLAMHSHFTGVRFYKNLFIGAEDLAILKRALKMVSM